MHGVNRIQCKKRYSFFEKQYNDNGKHITFVWLYATELRVLYQTLKRSLKRLDGVIEREIQAVYVLKKLIFIPIYPSLCLYYCHVIAI